MEKSQESENGLMQITLEQCTLSRARERMRLYSYSDATANLWEQSTG